MKIIDVLNKLRINEDVKITVVCDKQIVCDFKFKNIDKADKETLNRPIKGKGIMFKPGKILFNVYKIQGDQ